MAQNNQKTQSASQQETGPLDRAQALDNKFAQKVPHPSSIALNCEAQGSILECAEELSSSHPSSNSHLNLPASSSNLKAHDQENTAMKSSRAATAASKVMVDIHPCTTPDDSAIKQNNGGHHLEGNGLWNPPSVTNVMPPQHLLQSALSFGLGPGLMPGGAQEDQSGLFLQGSSSQGFKTIGGSSEPAPNLAQTSSFFSMENNNRVVQNPQQITTNEPIRQQKKSSEEENRQGGKSEPDFKNGSNYHTQHQILRERSPSTSTSQKWPKPKVEINVPKSLLDPKQQKGMVQNQVTAQKLSS